MKYYLAIDCRLFDYQTPLLVSCAYNAVRNRVYQYRVEYSLRFRDEWVPTRFSVGEEPYKPTNILLYLQTLNNLKLI